MKPVPAPAIIDGVEWTVRDSGEERTAYVDFSTTTMVVPMDCGPIGDLIRNHEMAHVAITPRMSAKELQALTKEFPNRTMQAAEDARVYAALIRAGIDTDVAHWPEKDVAGIAKLSGNKQYREEQARCLLATKGTADYERLVAVVPADITAKVSEVYDGLYQTFIDRGEVPPFQSTLDAAKALHDYFQEEEQEESGNEGEKQEGEDQEEKEEGGRGGYDPGRPFKPGDIENQQLQSEPSEALQLSEEEKKEVAEILGPSMMEYLESWHDNGKPLADDAVTFTRPKLTLTQKGHTTGNKKVCADTGTVPRRLARYATDGAVFSRTNKKGFASVLIDCSGSMNLTMEDVAHIVDSLPHCNVACYSGRKAHGEITLVAKDGKRSAVLPKQHGGNVVDFQALQWLVRQRGPRFWICDGIVTGAGDTLLGTIPILAIVKMCKLGRIKRFGSIDELLKGLSAKKSTAY